MQAFKAQLQEGIPIPGPAGPQGEPGQQGEPGAKGEPGAGALGVGRVGAGGIVYGATGWECQHSLLGTYNVIHNLNLDPLAYVVLVGLSGDPAADAYAPPSNTLMLTVTEQTADSFKVECLQGASLQNTAFNFALFM